MDRHRQSPGLHHQPAESDAGFDDRSLDALQPDAAQCGGCETESGPRARWRSAGQRSAAAGVPGTSPKTDYRFLSQLTNPVPAGRRREMAKTKAILIDITKCIGCMSCEKACKEIHGFPQDVEPTLSPTALT